MKKTFYEKDSDRKARLLAEFWAVKEKACKRCGVVKPNNFEHYHKKLFFDMHTHVTVDICRKCVSVRQQERWAKVKWDEYDYQVFKAKEAVRAARIARGATPDVPMDQWTDQDRMVYHMMPKTQPTVPRPS